jgi:uncharacterized protein
MKRALSIAFAVGAFALVPRVSMSQDRPAVADQSPDVETVGSGERRVAPDRATVLLYVETRNPSAAAAASGNSRSVAAVRDTLRRLGLDSAVTTSSYNVGADYDPRPVERDGGPRRNGYIARTVLRVSVRQLDLVGRVIDAGFARGATGVEGVFFEASTAEAARRDAMADAAVAARRDAEALARSLGGSLGPLISATTASGMDPRRMNVQIRGVGSAMSGTQVTPNEILITAGVVTRWRFVPGAR